MSAGSGSGSSVVRGRDVAEGAALTADDAQRQAENAVRELQRLDL
jgi:hypothetical protein